MCAASATAPPCLLRVNHTFGLVRGSERYILWSTPRCASPQTDRRRGSRLSETGSLVTLNVDGAISLECINAEP